MSSKYGTNLFLPFHSECKATLTDDSGVVKSPKFPQNYENNIDCTWLIELGNDKFIEIEFLSFDLEHHYNCKLVPFVLIISVRISERMSCEETAIFFLQILHIWLVHTLCDMIEDSNMYQYAVPVIVIPTQCLISM